MKQDNLYTGEEVREKLMAGINKCADAIGSTMGTGGSNGLIEAMENPGHMSTNDGATMLQSIHLADPIENMGKNILMEAVSRANKSSGDGSSTTTVLTRAILQEGTKYLKEASPMEIKRQLESCIPLIEESLNKQKREITVDEVGAVASISAEDEQIGQMIQEIYQKIGKEGIIHWDISKTAEDSYTIGSGLTIEDCGFYSPYMCDADQNGQNTNQIRLKNATILLTKQKITSVSDFNSLFETLFNKEIKDVVVFCDEVEPLVVPDLIKTRMLKGFRTILVKMPVLWKDQWYDDLAKATGAKVVDPTAGLTYKTMTVEHLGKCGNIVITKTQTFVDDILDLTEHVKALQEEATDDSLLRASRLNTKTARYFVGAHSDSALSYRRLKVEDAISASYQALHGGIVAGGGVALLRAAWELPKETVGGKILKGSLIAPLNQIILNIGIRESKAVFDDIVGLHVVNKLKDYKEGMPCIDGSGLYGVNTRTKEVVNMFEAHITDPLPVVFNAVKNAVSVAASILTTNTLITLPREDTPYDK